MHQSFLFGAIALDSTCYMAYHNREYPINIFPGFCVVLGFSFVIIIVNFCMFRFIPELK